MNHVDRVRRVLRDALSLGERAGSLGEDTKLLGGLPEFDSMAVVNVITMLEDEYGFTVADDELSGDVFQTLGSLTSFVARKAAT